LQKIKGQPIFLSFYFLSDVFVKPISNVVFYAIFSRLPLCHLFPLPSAVKPHTLIAGAFLPSLPILEHSYNCPPKKTRRQLQELATDSTPIPPFVLFLIGWQPWTAATTTAAGS
jgi:hypothetical protein